VCPAWGARGVVIFKKLVKSIGAMQLFRMSSAVPVVVAIRRSFREKLRASLVVVQRVQASWHNLPGLVNAEISAHQGPSRPRL
jgi:hypothetical protein